MGKLKLPVLQKGDLVCLIAPARAVSAEEMAPMIFWLEQKGLRVMTSKHFYGRHHQFSGTDVERAEDFIEAWTHPDVKALFCGRGGYGCMRMLPHIPPEIWNQGNKILAGFSDITTLHLVLNNMGIETLHAPVGISFYEPKAGTEDNFRLLEEVLFTGKISIDLNNHHMLNPSSFEGEIVGGNLSILFSACGTPEQPDLKDKILFIEDLDEYLYHIDRMMVSMDRARFFSQLKALIVGDLGQMKDNTIAFGQQAEEIVAHHTEKYGYPVIFGFPAGHGIKNYAFKLGAYTTFDGGIFEQF